MGDSNLTNNSKARNEKINALNIVPKSQVNDELHIKLSNNKKLIDFKALIRYCSSKQLTLDETVTLINTTFASYIGDNPMTLNRFIGMLDMYKDIGDAWSYGTCGNAIDLMKVRLKANEVMDNIDTRSDDPTKTMKSIEMYHKLYDDEYITKTNSKNINFDRDIEVNIGFGEDVGDGFE